MSPRHRNRFSAHPLSYHVIPSIPQSTISSDQTTISTNYPEFSTNAEALSKLITEQAAYPPTYTLLVKGTHTESFQARGNTNKEKRTVVDFDIKLPMTHLLICPNEVHKNNPTPCPGERNSDCRYLLTPQPGETAHRGTVFANREDIKWDTEDGQTMIDRWAEAFVNDKSGVKSFEMTRSVILHDTSVLEGLVRQLIDSTSYRGHTRIHCQLTNSKIVVYSPHRINALRQNWYFRWFCYLTFLWIFTWPALFFMTKRYTGVVALFPYRREDVTKWHPKNLNECTAKPLVMSEPAFFSSWRDALRRAVLAQHQGWVDEVYRADTAQMMARGETTSQVQSTEAAFLGGAIASVVSIATGRQVRTGWGADS
jgi:hypothetical protein